MSARRHRVPAIESTAAEELLHGLLRELAAHLSQALADDGIRHGFIGGTALKIGYGLTRPSTDLDVKVETPRYFTTYVGRANPRRGIDIAAWTGVQRVPRWLSARAADGPRRRAGAGR